MTGHADGGGGDGGFAERVAKLGDPAAWPDAPRRVDQAETHLSNGISDRYPEPTSVKKPVAHRFRSDPAVGRKTAAPHCEAGDPG